MKIVNVVAITTLDHPLDLPLIHSRIPRKLISEECPLAPDAA